MRSGKAEAADLVEALTEWGKEDLLAVYTVLYLGLQWAEQTTWQAVWEAGELRAVAARWDPIAGQEAPIHCCYAAREERALREVLTAAPPAPGCLIFAPNTPCHGALRGVAGATEKPCQVFRIYEGEAPPDSPEVDHFGAEEAIAAGLTEPWDWPSILGKQPAPRPIHCICREGRAVAVASAGGPSALTEEVRGVWVVSEFRRQGLGRAVVAAATRDILSRDRLPVYMHDRENTASQRTAESVGYARRGEILVLAVEG